MTTPHTPRLPDLIELVSHIYDYDGYLPSSEILSKVRIPDVVSFLKLSHQYYIDVAMKSLESAVQSVLAPCDEKRKKVILSFFNSYKDEMLRHFAYEEEQVFPYAEALMEGRASEVTPVLEEDHTDIVEKIDDLRNIVSKYLPPECDPVEALTLMKQLYYLSDDLRKHTSIEDHILLPLMRKMEKDGFR